MKPNKADIDPCTDAVGDVKGRVTLASCCREPSCQHITTCFFCQPAPS